jgi:Membrane bound FAD containing D-sorbitol dehydrogenase
MDEPDASLYRRPRPDPDRRTLLTGLTATYLFSYFPAVIAQPADAAPRDAFMAVSRILTGRPTLDPDQAARLYEALVADAPGFPADVQALRSFLDERKIDPIQLQSTLDAEQSPLTAVPRSIVKAWYTGIVGEAERARCITFETSLMHVAVADRLNPPSYCYGSYGSWMDQPV